METVLVTGGSGFIGSYCIMELLSAGYRVRTTVRSLAREQDVRGMLQGAGAVPDERLQFFAADLEHDNGWPQAVAGSDYVLHVASPFPEKVPKHEDELIIPARDGALRVLRAAQQAGVKRVVLTSSFAAIGYGRDFQGKTLDETQWTDVHAPNLPAYHKSKTLAERAAWDFVAQQAGNLELATVNPVGVFGPILGHDYATSILVIRRMMEGFPACPKMSVGVVDVRDVANLHVLAMTHPAAKGERFLAVSGNFMSLLDVAKILKRRLGDAAKKVPTREVPNWLLRLGALIDPTVRIILPELGKSKNASSAKAIQTLGWKPRANEETIVATAESLLRLGILPR